jgi:hypothetical protein
MTEVGAKTPSSCLPNVDMRSRGNSDRFKVVSGFYQNNLKSLGHRTSERPIVSIDIDHNYYGILVEMSEHFRESSIMGWARLAGSDVNGLDHVNDRQNGQTPGCPANFIHIPR